MKARDDDDDTILVCMPIARLLTPVLGSIAVPCHDCEQPVWRSPSANQVTAVVLCFGCAVARVRAARLRRSPVKFGGYLPGQLDELKRALEPDVQ